MTVQISHILSFNAHKGHKTRRQFYPIYSVKMLLSVIWIEQAIRKRI